MRLVVDLNKCQGYAQCVPLAPEVLKMVGEETRDVFGLGQGERIAGFIYIGTSAEAPLERVRPNLDGLISRP